MISICILTVSAVLLALFPNKVSAVGRNLFDKNDFDLVALYPKTDNNAGGQATSGNISHSLILAVEPETEYTFSMYDIPSQSKRNRMNIGFYGQYPYAGLGALGVDTSYTREGDYVYNTFTTPTACHYILLFLWSDSSFTEQVIESIIDTCQLQLEFGATRTPYEEYTTLSFTGFISPVRWSTDIIMQGSEEQPEYRSAELTIETSAIGGSGTGYRFDIYLEGLTVDFNKTLLFGRQKEGQYKYDIGFYIEETGAYQIEIVVTDSTGAKAYWTQGIVKLQNAIHIEPYSIPQIDMSDITGAGGVNFGEDEIELAAESWSLIPPEFTGLLAVVIISAFIGAYLWRG